MDINGKTVAITGAAGAIGFAMAEEFLSKGAKSVAVMEIKGAHGKEATEKLLNKYGKGRAIYVECDVANSDEFKASFDKVVAAFGKIDVFVNNAGVVNEAGFKEMVLINIGGLIHGTLMALNHMGSHIGAKGGAIINMASITGLNPLPILPAYSSTKCAVVGFGTALAENTGSRGVRILTLCPGFTSSPILSDITINQLDVLNVNKIRENLNSQYLQKPKTVAEAAVQLCERGKNGAIWVTEDDEPPYAYELPDRKQLKSVV
ncbi:15-hydroxyprostaglandin dehydrogenase [NAD(+)] [Orussus abietinus]|uniref:15-hydroxyprostaglandin dehydrogenase [NAD(+)] n=1 Tax=Orussus abietinus TaxID=222816 RepID=UPI000626D03E|nr:15-hydroxyprostaglandin dehydrogenase [NAD(+)] [Orussus abietinus]